MDVLAAEIARKRKEIEESRSDPESKYIRRSDVERKHEEEYLREQQARDAERERKRLDRIQQSAQRERERFERQTTLEREQWEKKMAAENEALTESELNVRLRAIDEPIKLFGETVRQRKARLHVVEARRRREDEQRLRDADEEQEMLEIDFNIDIRSLKVNRPLLMKQISAYLKYLLREWHDSVDTDKKSVDTSDRQPSSTVAKEFEHDPAALERSRMSLASAEKDLIPLFDALRAQSLSTDMVENLSMALYNCQQRNYLKASDMYLRLSIGNLAWPIGLKEVGIHERAARDRLASKKVANVLVDEATRKWLQSVKRCLTFAQDRWPPERESMRMG